MQGIILGVRISVTTQADPFNIYKVGAFPSCVLHFKRSMPKSKLLPNTTDKN